MKRIVITGGIGAGKSLCGKILEERGEAVIDADLAARKYNAAARERAAEIFAEPVKLRALEELIHPRVAADIKKQTEALEKAGRERVFILVPALAHFAAEIERDYTIALISDRETRIARVASQRGLAREEIEKRMAQQAGDAEIIARAHAVIYNGGTEEELIKELLTTYNNLV